MSKILLKDLPNTSYQNIKHYNIVKDYPWTFSPNKSEDVPTITLTEFEQDECTLWAQLRYWNDIKTDQLQAGSANPYKALYHAKPTLTQFIFPYFEQYDHQINQNWEKTKGIQDFSIIEKAVQLATIWAKLTKQSPGTSINQPQIWAGSGGASYNVNFTLFNTIDINASMEKTIKKNYDFRQRILMSSLHNQETLILATPPAIFTVEIPGVRISPAAVISQITVNQIGQINQMEIASEVNNGQLAGTKRLMNIPDAWEFNIQITELISESRQILEASNQQLLEPVRAIEIVPESTTP